MADPPDWLVMMVKRPVAGAVKTRLARAAGVAVALGFYRAAMASTLRALSRDPRWRLVLAISPDTALDDPVWPQGCARIPQGPGDLGARMQRILDRMPHGRVCIVGSDIPGIAPGAIARSFHALGDADVVFGPAEDGGYWLVGARRRPRVPELFADVRWSTEHALADTVNNTAGLTVAETVRLADVDTIDDLKRWRSAGSYSTAA